MRIILVTILFISILNAVPTTTCCDPNPPVGTCFEGCACCPDGTWVSSIGNAQTFYCNGVECTGAENCGGTLCEEPSTTLTTATATEACCDPAMGIFTNNQICREGCECCRDGKWVGSWGDAKTFTCGDITCSRDGVSYPLCGGTICEEPSTTVTESCCDPAMGVFTTNSNCEEGCVCCQDGTWAGSIGDGQTFYCSGVECNGAENCGGTLCETTDEPTTTVTETCCDPKEATSGICWEGCACCPDGRWSGSIGDGKTFNCGKSCSLDGELLPACGGTICGTPEPTGGTTKSETDTTGSSDYCNGDDLLYVNLATSCRWDNSLSVDGIILCELCLCNEERSARICEKITDVENWPDWFGRLFDYKFNYICHSDVYTDLQDEDGNQCKLENIRPKSADQITFCDCNALFCCKQNECDTYQMPSNGNTFGVFGIIAVVMAILSWM